MTPEARKAFIQAFCDYLEGRGWEEAISFGALQSVDNPRYRNDESMLEIRAALDAGLEAAVRELRRKPGK